MRDAPLGQRIAQSLDNMFLADQFAKGLGAISAIQRLGCHSCSLWCDCGLHYTLRGDPPQAQICECRLVICRTEYNIPGFMQWMRSLDQHGSKISRIERFSFRERKTFDTKKKNP